MRLDTSLSQSRHQRIRTHQEARNGLGRFLRLAPMTASR